MNKKGFTLIELIIVIAVIALLAAAVFVAVDPAKRIGEARDAQRWSDVSAIADAFLKDTVDQNGTFPTSTAADGTYYAIMPVGGTDLTSPTCQNQAPTQGVQLSGLVTTYLATMPIDPGGLLNGDNNVGYYFMKAATGRITVGACAESNYADASIYVQR